MRGLHCGYLAGGFRFYEGARRLESASQWNVVVCVVRIPQLKNSLMKTEKSKLHQDDFKLSKSTW